VPPGIVDCVEEKTIECYYPNDHPAQQPAFWQMEDPGFVTLKSVTVIGDRRASDYWVYCRIAYLRKAD
jgi:hypothetical protein